MRGRPGGGSDAPVDVHNLSVRYDGTSGALAGVTLAVAPGRAVAVLGPNGAGKTTLLRAISGLLGFRGGEVTGGRVTVGERVVAAPGRRPDAAAIVRLGVSHVMEGRRVFAGLSVDDNLAAGAFTRHDREGVRADRARVLRLFPALARRASTAAGHLSGGEQQMLAIARALMAAPRVLLLDEPSLGLAPLVVEDIRRALEEIRAGGTGLLVAEQQAALALDVADDVVLLDRGRVVAAAPAAAMAADDRVRALYLGERHS